MSLGAAQVRVEVFRGPPVVFDDNMVNGWTDIAGSSSSDGDVRTSTGTDIIMEKTFSAFSSDTYPKFAIRVTSFSATNWYVQLYYDSVWNALLSNQTGTGLVEATIPAGKSVTGVRIGTNGTGSIAVDYISIGKKTVLILADGITTFDVLDEMTITSPLLSKGISGAKLKIPNNNAQYTGQISDFDNIIIWLTRTASELGTPTAKVFGGKIIKPGTSGIADEQGLKHFIHLDCMGYGFELQVPPALLQKLYDGTNGKTIINDAVALCNIVTNKFVDVDNDIASTHDIEADEVTAWNIIRQVCDVAKTAAGAVGFDGYVDPAGNLHIFKRNKYTSGVSLTEKLLVYKFDLDAHRIRNKIKVYGVEDKRFPSDGDQYTEQDASETPGDDGWIIVYGDSVSWDSSRYKVGSESLLAQGLNIGVLEVAWQAPSALSCFGRGGYKIFNFHLYKNQLDAVRVRLYAPDGSNYFWYPLLNITGVSGWSEHALPVGSRHDSEWFKVGSPSWNNVVAVGFRFGLGLVNDKELNVDGMYFGSGRFSGSAEATAGVYGVRMPEPVIDDSLKTDVECTKRAESLRDFLKNAVTTFPLTTIGDKDLTAGDHQYVSISNDNIADYYRIIEIRHRVQGIQWETDLILEDEPVLVDYVFRLLKAGQKILQRRT